MRLKRWFPWNYYITNVPCMEYLPIYFFDGFKPEISGAHLERNQGKSHQNAPLMQVEVDVLTLEDTAWEVPPTPRRRKNEEGLRGLMNFTQGHMVTCLIKNKRVNEHKWGTTDGFQQIHDYLVVDVVETIGANKPVNDMTCINSSATSHTHHQTDCCLLLCDIFETGLPIWQ